MLLREVQNDANINLLYQYNIQLFLISLLQVSFAIYVLDNDNDSQYLFTRLKTDQVFILM